MLLLLQLLLDLLVIKLWCPLMHWQSHWGHQCSAQTEGTDNSTPALCAKHSQCQLLYQTKDVYADCCNVFGIHYLAGKVHKGCEQMRQKGIDKKQDPAVQNEPEGDLNSCGSRALPDELAGDTGSCSCKGCCQWGLPPGPVVCAVCWAPVASPAALCNCTAAVVATCCLPASCLTLRPSCTCAHIKTWEPVASASGRSACNFGW